MKVLAVDIGGTQIKGAIIENGTLYHKKVLNSYGNLGVNYVLDALYQLIDNYEIDTYETISICTTGQVDTHTKEILCENENIPGYKGLQLGKLLKERYQKGIYLENDVNAAAIGEAHYGSGIGIPSFLCLTYGTGIGGAIMENSQLIRGQYGYAGEVGHMIIHAGGTPCNCGFAGCYEMYASTTALVHKVSSLYPDLTDGREIFGEVEKKNLAVIALVDDWIQEIIYGLVTLIHIFNPSHIILGGGILSQSYIIHKIREKLSSTLMDGFQEVTILQVKLGNDAGLYGMAYIAMNS